MDEWKYRKIRVTAKLDFPNRFEQAVSRAMEILRQEPEFTFLRMKEFETEDGAGEWVVSIIWAHHDGDIVEMEEAHKSLTGAFYRCVDHWLFNREARSCEGSSTPPSQFGIELSHCPSTASIPKSASE